MQGLTSADDGAVWMLNVVCTNVYVRVINAFWHRSVRGFSFSNNPKDAVCKTFNPLKSLGHL